MKIAIRQRSRGSDIAKSCNQYEIEMGWSPEGMITDGPLEGQSGR